MANEKELVDCETFKAGIQEDHRPWGKFRRFPHECAGSIKIITVNPGGVLSLQYHSRRNEFWVVLDDGLEVTLGDRLWRPKAGEEIWVPAGVKHRAKGVGPAPARFFEIWVGDSEESDIVRIEDIYHR